MLPNVYYFNPTCEYAVANGTVSWQPKRLLQKMEAELGTLPLFLAESKDILLVKKQPTQKFLDLLTQLEIQLPAILTIEEALTNDNFLLQPKGELLPWGWSPATHHLLKPLKPLCSDKFLLSPNASWKSEYKEMYSKKTAIEILKHLTKVESIENILPTEYIPKVCTNLNKISLLADKWGKLMVKAPWSSSGRGLQMVSELPIHTSVNQRIQGLINEQGYVIVEPFLNKIVDFAFQFKIQNREIEFLGISFFETDKNGSYKGNYIYGMPKKLNDDKVRFINKAIENLVPFLRTILSNSIFATKYEGFIGVDAMLYFDQNKQFKIHPCLEVNARQNMGILSFYLEKIISKGKSAMFKTYYDPNNLFCSFSEAMTKKHPPKITNRKIENGFFPVTDPYSNNSFGAYIFIN